MSFADLWRRGAWRHSLMLRLTLVSAAVSFAVLAAACVVLLVAISTETAWIDEQVMLKRVDTLRDLLAGDSSAQAWLAHEVSEDLDGPRRIFIRILDAHGAVQFETPGMVDLLPAKGFPSATRAAMGVLRSVWLRGPNNERYFGMSLRTPQAHESGPSTVATIQIATDRSLDALVIARYRTHLAWILVVAFVSVAACSAIVTRHGLRPLHTMTRAVDDIDPANPTLRLDTTSTPVEVRELGGKLNQALDRLEAHQARLRGYADDVAHEMRSPLHALMLEADIALLNERTPDEYRSALAAQREELKSLADLVDRLLIAARLDSGEQVAPSDLVDVSRVVARVAAQGSEDARRAGVTLMVDGAPEALVNGDEMLLATAIGNLLRNAIAHTPPGRRIRLLSGAGQDGVQIHVIDEGEGIPTERLEHIFERFVRIDPTRDRSKGRVGLGLSIVRSVVRMHGGLVDVESAPGRGAHFTIKLPAIAAVAQSEPAEV